MSGWNKDHEENFIANLGKYAGNPGNLSRAELLRGYLAGCRRRTEWGDINKSYVIALAERQLKLCEVI